MYGTYYNNKVFSALSITITLISVIIKKIDKTSASFLALNTINNYLYNKRF